MTAKKRRRGEGRGRTGRASSSGEGSTPTEGVKGLLLTIWASVALVLVTGLYRAGRGELALGHWLAFVVVVLMGVAVTLTVMRDPGA